MAQETKRLIRRSILYILTGLIIAAGCIDNSDVVEIASVEEYEEYTEETSDVALVRSSREDVFDITDEEIRSMVREAVELAGGMESVVENGDSVVLKPNIAGGFDGSMESMALMDLEAGIFGNPLGKGDFNGIATDYRVVRAVAELVREVNPDGRVYVIEGSPMFTAQNMALLGYTHEDIPGIDEFVILDDVGRDMSMSEEEMVAVDLEDKGMYDFENSLTHTNGLYYVEKTYYNADVLISLPCLKNHRMASVTGAIKNVGIGGTPMGVYCDPAMGLSRMGIDHGLDRDDNTQLHRWIHDYYMVKPVDFVVTDGLQGLQYGPLAEGSPNLETAQMNSRVILAGKDAVAVDTIQALIVGVDPEKVDHIRYVADEELGIMDISRVNVLGNARVSDVKGRKPFLFPEPPFSQHTAPAGTVYDDYEAPALEVANVNIAGGVLTADITTSRDTVKVEMYINGNLVKVFNGNFDAIEYEPAGNEEGTLEFRAYDRFLNASVQEFDGIF